MPQLTSARGDCPNRSSDGGSSSFISLVGGKLILYLAIPLFIIFSISVFIFWFIRRRQRRRLHRDSRRGPQESALSLQVSPSVIMGPSPREKQPYFPYTSRSILTMSLRSGRNSPRLSIEEDVFISYNKAKEQGLSNKWYNSPTTLSPLSEKNGRIEKRFFAPDFGLSVVTKGARSERSQSPHCPSRSQRSGSSGRSGYSSAQPPWKSGLETRDAREERDEGMMWVSEDNDPMTSSMYSPARTFITHHTSSDAGNSTHGTPTPIHPQLTGDHVHFTNITRSSSHPTVEQEKTNVFSSPPAAFVPGHSGRNIPQNQLQRMSLNEPLPSPTKTERASTIALSDIISIFGAPPASERRMSMMTDHTSNTASYPWFSHPESVGGGFLPPLPTISTYPRFDLASIISSSGSGGPTPPTVNTDLESYQFELRYLTPRSVSGLGSEMRSSRILTPPKRTPSSVWSTYSSPFHSPSDTNPGLNSLSYQTSTSISTPYRTSSFIHFTLADATMTSQAPVSYTIPVREGPVGGITGMSGEGELGRHKRNLSNWTHLTDRSAARPDSEVMPFENFIYSLNTAAMVEAETQRVRDGRSRIHKGKK